MSGEVHIIRRMLRSTALGGILALLATPAFAQSFDPNSGTADGSTAAPAPLPSTAPLLDTTPKLVFPKSPLVHEEVLSPAAAAGVPSVPSNDPTPAAIAAAPPTAPEFSGTIADAPGNPAPAPLVTIAQPAAPRFPPVDPAIAREAQQEIAAQPSLLSGPAPVQPGIIAAPPNFAAPAPLLALTPPAPAPIPVAAAPLPTPMPAVAVITPVTPPPMVTPVAPTPVVVAQVAPASIAAAPVIITPVTTTTHVVQLAPSTPVAAVLPDPAPSSVAATDPGLSAPTKAILHKLPAKLGSTGPAPAGGKLDVSRTTPAMKDISADNVQSYDAVGLSIKVAKPGLDTNFELNRAYTALMGGDNQSAIEIYKSVLAADPQNQDALFGLASTYHRSGELEKARPYYGELLKINPNHREGLNNFLALVSDESPNEALAELGRLEQRNPDFSPIPAQEAIVMNKLGYYEQARDKMLRAIELAPENLTYKYNLAVMMDHHGDYVDASALYRMLIDASLKGEKLPASTETLQKRLNYITTAAAHVVTTGG